MPAPNLLALTSTTAGILASQQLPTGATTIYTAPNNATTKLGRMVLANVSGSAVSVSVSVVPAGGTVDGTHRVTGTFSIVANDSAPIDEVKDIMISAGDYVTVTTSAGAAIDVTLTGLVLA